MAKKVIDIIYNLVRRRLAQSGAFDRGPGITSLPNPKAVESGMQQIFKQLKDGGLNPVSADKLIKTEDDLLRVIEEINQKKIAQAEAMKKADAGITRVFDKIKRNIPLNPDDQAALQGSGFKTALDNFKGFEPKVIEGGKNLTMKTPGGEIPYIESPTQTIMQGGKKVPVKIPKGTKDDLLASFDNVNLTGDDTKYDADVLATDLAERRGFIKEGQDGSDMDQKDYSKLYSEAYSFLTRSRFLNKPKKAAGGLIKAVKALRKKYGKDIIQKGKAPKDRAGRKKLRKMFRDFEKRAGMKTGGITNFLKKLFGKKKKSPSEDFKDYLKKMKEESDRLNKEFYEGLKPGGKLDQDIEKIKEGYKFPDEKEIKKIMKEKMDKKKLEKFDVEGRKPNAGGGLAYMLGEPRQAKSMGGAINKFLKMLSEKSPFERYKDYLASVKRRSIEGDFKSLAPEMGAITAGGIFANRRMKDLLETKNEEQKERLLEEFKRDLDRNSFYKDYPELKDKAIENFTKTLFGENKADGGRIGFADGGMSRRTFLKIMAALAAFPVVGKLAKTTKIAKGAKPIITPTAEMPAHFPKLVEKIIKEGQVVKKDFVKKTGDVTTYRHPERTDIELTIEGDGNRIQLEFETDQGMKAGYEFRKGDIIDEPTSEMRGKRVPEFDQGEVKYRTNQDGSYTKDFEEGIDTGTENLDDFAGIGKQKTSKSKVILNDEGEAVVRIDEDLAEGGLAGLLGE